MTKMQELEAEYKQFAALKKQNKGLADFFVLFHQKTLIAAGLIHNKLVADGVPLDDFYNTPLGFYYKNWRETRAISVADMMGVSQMLNVSWKPEEIVGETFYAGIPPVTAGEIANAAVKYDTTCAKNVEDMVGVDGKMHTFDVLDGCYDPKDIYGDGSMVEVPKEEAEEKPKCFKCQHWDGDGSECSACDDQPHIS